MKVKGVAVQSLPDFVHDYHAQGYGRWIDHLSAASREILINPIMTSSWYPIREAMIEPTRVLCDVFYQGRPKGAWEAGRFSADQALRGVHKVFVKVGSPHFLIDRATRIFPAYYEGAEMDVVRKEPNLGMVRITSFPVPSAMVEKRIGGWMERALEISGCRKVSVRIGKSLAAGDAVTEFYGTWE